MDQIAQHCFFFDDARVMLDVRYSRHAVGERGEVRRSTGSFQIATAMQFFGQGDEVDRLLRFAERDHLGENTAVLIEKKIVRTQMLDRSVKSIVVEQHGAENGALGVQVVR